jgi:NitT/TauT family transport system substrate-binding protein
MGDEAMHSRGKLCVSLVFAAICVCALGRAEAADKVTFVTDFGYNGRHAYYFVALEKGYYARQNLDVQIVRGQGSADAVKQVAAGTAQIGFADTAAVILGRANDQIPTKLVAIVYAKPPHAIYVLKESGIAKPKDLERSLPTPPSVPFRSCFKHMPRPRISMRTRLLGSSPRPTRCREC